jgi:LemA protein
MTAALIVAGLLIVLGLIVGLWYVKTYNMFVKLAVAVDTAWSQVDVQLKRRYDLIPNLVETVKGYASHESETLEAVIQARNAGMTATTPAEAAAGDNMITQALGKLFALQEAYPNLKANENFLSLQQEVTVVEEKVAYARQYYNATVQDLNTKRLVFPSSIVAGSKPKFAAREFFEVDDETQRAAPKIQF